MEDTCHVTMITTETKSYRIEKSNKMCFIKSHSTFIRSKLRMSQKSYPLYAHFHRTRVLLKYCCCSNLSFEDFWLTFVLVMCNLSVVKSHTASLFRLLIVIFESSGWSLNLSGQVVRLKRIPFTAEYCPQDELQFLFIL